MSIRKARPRLRVTTDERAAEKIREAAVKKFAESGYDGASMRNIGESLGVNAGSIYLHYKAKEDILYQIVDDATEATSLWLREIEESDADAIEKLRMIARHYFRWVLENPEEAKVCERDWMRLGGERLSEIEIKRRNCTIVVERILTAGIEGGVFRGINVVFGAVAFRAMLNANYFFVGDPEERGNELADEFVDFLINGIKL